MTRRDDHDVLSPDLVQGEDDGNPDNRLPRLGRLLLGLLSAVVAVALLLPAPAAAGSTDPASAAALTALGHDEPRRALTRIPASFEQRFGYRPQIRDGLLVDPHGDCSSPVPLPRSFENACRQHDLGYDLLRSAGAEGGTVPAGARRALDDRLQAQMSSSCDGDSGRAARAGCRALSVVAGIAVRLNSIRQHDGVPGPESGRSLLTIGAFVAALMTLLCSAVMAARRPLRRFGVATLDRARAAATQVGPGRTVGAAVAIAIAGFPSALPRPAALVGVSAVLVYWSGRPLVAAGRRLIRRRRNGRTHRPRRPVLAVLAAAAPAAGAFAVVAAQNDVRAAVDAEPWGWPDHVIATAAALVTVGLGVAVTNAGRALWRRRRPWWRVVALGSVVLIGAAAVMPSARADRGDDVPADGGAMSGVSATGAVRTYVGFREGPSAERRADLAVRRVAAAGGFERAHLVLLVPTGSGWVDPALIEGLERRFGRDLAIVSVGYDDRPSWQAYLFHRDQAVHGTRALVGRVTDRVAALPAGRRPQVHLVGESLGASAGQQAMNGAVCSALWVGAPGGPRPRLGRQVWVSNPTDPVSRLSLDTLVRPPADGAAWLPVVSAVQNGTDLLGALSFSRGHGHRYRADVVDRLPTC